MGMTDHLANPDSRSWDDLKRDVEFTPEEQAEIDAGAQRLIAEARAFRLAEVRLVHRNCPFLSRKANRSRLACSGG
jgi:hypothetical protein